jgi:1-deoxy-D-xylulose-5-phosphate synthase
MLEIGKAEILRDGADDAVILAVGSMVYPAIEAAALLGKRRNRRDGRQRALGIKPLDGELILNLAQTKRTIITVEEAYLAGGFGSAVLEFLEENDLQ